MQSLTEQDRLRLSLRASLRDALMSELTFDANRSVGPPSASSVILPSPPQSPSVMSGTWNGSSLAPSLGLEVAAAAKYAPRGGGGPLSLTHLLVAASVRRRQESQVLNQLQTALAQHKLNEEKKRIVQEKARLMQDSYIAYLRHQFNSRAMAEDTSSQDAMQDSPMAMRARLAGHSDPETNPTGTLRALGSHLRNRTDPYIDVSALTCPGIKSVATPKARGGVVQPFPAKLHQMLAETDREGKSDIVSFFPHGRAFAVHDMDRFVKEIMPRYFKQSKWNSFARQLNLYGFTRMEGTESSRAFYHELFLRGRPDLAAYMRRVGVPQGEDRRKVKPKCSASDPDFYSMTCCDQATNDEGKQSISIAD